MRRVWSFLSDPGLHLLMIVLALIVLAIGSTGPPEPGEESPLVACSKCGAHHYLEPAGSCTGRTGRPGPALSRGAAGPRRDRPFPPRRLRVYWSRSIVDRAAPAPPTHAPAPGFGHAPAIHLHRSRIFRSPSPSGRSSRTSGSRSTRGPRSACWGATARARARSCGSWPGSTRTSSGPPGPRPGPGSATSRRSRLLDPTLDVRGNVELAVAPTRALLNRYDEINARLGEPLDPDEMEKLLDEQGRVQDAIEAANAWELDRNIEIAMDAMRLPPGDADGLDPLRRREAPGGPLQDPPGAARRPAPGRAHQPPRRRVRRLARAAPLGVSRDRRGGHPRPLLPRQRRRLDPRARPRPGHPLAGELHLLARAEAGPAGQGGEAGEQPPEDPGPRAGVGPHGPPRPGRQEPRPAGPLRAARQPGQREARRGDRPPDPARPAPGRPRRLGRGGQEGVRRPPPGRGHDLPPAARRDRRDHRPQRRGQDHPVPDDRRPGDARRRGPPGGRHRGHLLRRPEPRDPQPREHDLPGDHRRASTRSSWASARSRPGPTSPRSTSRGPTRRRRSPTSPAASGTGSTWPSSSRAAATSCSWTSRPTTSTSTCSGPSRRRSSTSAAAPW